MAKRWILVGAAVAVVASVLVVAPAGVVSAQGPATGFDARRDLVYVDPDSTAVVDVLENDIDTVADAAHEVSIVTPPSDGVASVVVDSDGEASVSYTPDAGFQGEDRVRYEACVGADCDEANIILYVGPGACTIVGTNGPDVLVGTAGRDVICAGDGADIIDGLGGADLIFAGRGADIVNAGPGRDQVFGGRGADVLNGDGGQDEIHGNRGADVIDGGPGDDELFGGKGDDEIRGSGGDDLIAGRRGADRLFGNGGADVLRGGRGADELRGGGGPDLLRGGRGGDVLRGGAGDDELRGGRGGDALNGGDGNDFLRGGRGTDDCVNGETLQGCETGEQEPGVEIVAIVELPVDPTPTSFGVEAPLLDGVSLDIETNGGLYPWDLNIHAATVSAEGDALLVSELVDLQQNPDSPAFASASLTLGYDDTILNGYPESDLLIYTYDETAQEWVPAAAAQTIDVTANTVTVDLEHLSCYAVFRNPDDPFFNGGPGSNCRTVADTDVFESSVIKIDGLPLPQSALFQPTSYGETLALTSRLRAVRQGDIIEISRITFDQGVPYDANFDLDQTNSLCAQACADVLAFAEATELAFPDGGVVGAAVGLQKVFGEGDFVASYFVKEQLALECFGVLGDLDRCVLLAEAFHPDADNTFDPETFETQSLDSAFQATYTEFTPTQVDDLLQLVLADNAYILSTLQIMVQLGRVSVGLEIQGGSGVSDFVGLRAAVTDLHREIDWISSSVGSSSFTVADLVAIRATAQAERPALVESIDWLSANYSRLDSDEFRDGRFLATPTEPFTGFKLATSMIRLEAYKALAPSATRGVVESFPVVDRANGPLVDLRLFSGFEPQLIDVLELALAATGPDQYVAKQNLVTRLPETDAGIRNQIITSLYFEYAEAVGDWLDGTDQVADDTALNWAYYAAYASQAVNDPIRGEFQWLIDIGGQFLDLRSRSQAAADGNQWIFSTAGRRYAQLVELLATNQNPSMVELETFFAQNFGPGDQVIRDAVVAMVSSRYAATDQDQQRLRLLSTALLGQYEQAGIHQYLQTFGDGVPDLLTGIFINLRLGNRELNVDVDLQDIYGDLNNPPSDGSQNGLLWNRNLIKDLTLLCASGTSVCADPSYPQDDPSDSYDSPGLDISIGQPATPAVLDLDDLSAFADGLNTGWDQWRANADPSASAYSGSGVNRWPDFDERMWYLLNLFRATVMDDSIKDEPDMSFRGPFFDDKLLSPEAIGALGIDILKIEVQPPAIVTPPHVSLSASASQTPPSVIAGDNVTIVVQTQNQGLTAAAGVNVRIQIPFGLELVLPIPLGCVVGTDLLERWVLCDRDSIAAQTTNTLTVEFSTELFVSLPPPPDFTVGYGVAQNGDLPALDQLLTLNIEPSE